MYISNDHKHLGLIPVQNYYLLQPLEPDSLSPVYTIIRTPIIAFGVYKISVNHRMEWTYETLPILAETIQCVPERFAILCPDGTVQTDDISFDSYDEFLADLNKGLPANADR